MEAFNFSKYKTINEPSNYLLQSIMKSVENLINQYNKQRNITETLQATLTEPTESLLFYIQKQGKLSR